MRQRGAYITGEVELTAKGSAYIISNESKEDVFVAFPNLKHALNGDKVKVWYMPGVVTAAPKERWSRSWNGRKVLLSA